MHGFDQDQLPFYYSAATLLQFRIRIVCRDLLPVQLFSVDKSYRFKFSQRPAGEFS